MCVPPNIIWSNEFQFKCDVVEIPVRALPVEQEQRVMKV